MYLIIVSLGLLFVFVELAFFFFFLLFTVKMCESQVCVT